MPTLKRTRGKYPAMVYGALGMKVSFDASGLAEVDETVAQYFAGVPGYEIVSMPEPTTEQVPEPPTEEPDFDFEAFKNSTWQQQRARLSQGSVPVEFLQQIVDGNFTDSVKATAQKQIA